jgi:hypothetical protein
MAFGGTNVEKGSHAYHRLENRSMSSKSLLTYAAPTEYKTTLNHDG